MGRSCTSQRLLLAPAAPGIEIESRQEPGYGFIASGSLQAGFIRAQIQAAPVGSVPQRGRAVISDPNTQHQIALLLSAALSTAPGHFLHGYPEKISVEVLKVEIVSFRVKPGMTRFVAEDIMIDTF